ncbi:pilin [Patescibacteria group bacterium]|nr:pilin [Patescibacteria group bacterium]
MSSRLIATGVLMGILVSFTYSTGVLAMDHSYSSVLIAADAVPHKVEQNWDPIPLIEPIGDKNSIPVEPGGTLPFLILGGDRMPWIITVAIGIVTLWVLVSGGMIIIVGGDQSARGTWIEHIKWAIIGLVCLALVGTILKFLNASFFVS